MEMVAHEVAVQITLMRFHCLAVEDARAGRRGCHMNAFLRPIGVYEPLFKRLRSIVGLRHRM